MKKVFVGILALIMVLGLVGCSNSSNISVEGLHDALIKHSIELDNFKISENDNVFLFETANEDVKITGTTDKNKNIIEVKFENFGTDSSFFKNKGTLESWYLQEKDMGSMTMGSLKRHIVAYNCIDELEAFYSLCMKSDEGANLFAINTLLNKESSEIENWSISVSIIEGEYALEDTILIEATYKK